MVESGIGIRMAYNYAVNIACRHYNLPEANAVCALLFEEITGYSRFYIHTNPEYKLNTSQTTRLNRALDQLETGMPVQYITGIAWFGDFKLTVYQGVLIPRQETAELPEIIKKEWSALGRSPSRIIDLGTGTGCLAIALARIFNDAAVYAIDFNKIALSNATENARRMKCNIRIEYDDILTGLRYRPDGKFDIIVSNPPYVTELEKQQMDVNVLEFEPHSALFVPDSSPYIYYEAIARHAKHQLSPEGRLYVEINEQAGIEICRIFRENDLCEPVIYQDLNGKDRFVRAFLKGL
jgi:release factor glutamine methyltransferase